jgi:elongation factor Ts
VEVVCETDFVARNAEFMQFSKDVAMQIAACSPIYIKKEDVPEEVIAQEQDKALFYKNHCLLDQPYVKDSSITINDYMATLLAKFRENIMIRRFIRYKIGA